MEQHGPKARQVCYSAWGALEWAQATFTDANAGGGPGTDWRHLCVWTSVCGDVAFAATRLALRPVGRLEGVTNAAEGSPTGGERVKSSSGGTSSPTSVEPVAWGFAAKRVETLKS